MVLVDDDKEEVSLQAEIMYDTSSDGIEVRIMEGTCCGEVEAARRARREAPK